ncbi:DNA-binding response regulator [Embleya scabrispora]|uniref:DNA-binding response regulator n=1 Tax=Embleya scabrispora TaxID=159449 RepID=A0A1T3NM28_9ACTN|nr:response regulator transcription factor [Embleya scabrispora]OPC77782.1 DNA-binding response regulator [Embleya scabrispora]
MDAIRVVVADDQVLVRGALAVLVDTAEGMTVVGEASNGREAVELARANRADVVLMDLRMPEMDGIEATRLIAADEDLAGVRVLVLTTFETTENVLEALRAGANGFLAKDTRPAELLVAIRAVAQGEALLSSSATAFVINQLLSRPDHAAHQSDLAALTDREREVLGLVAGGLSNQEIAEGLVVSPLTVKTHVSRILAKLGARDRPQLVVAAYESGLVRPGWTRPNTPRTP